MYSGENEKNTVVVENTSPPRQLSPLSSNAASIGTKDEVCNP